ncbi:hemerythrin domain-containing protein [Ferruginibacter sp. SUN106]|uniref:hemerythrin domain-containing protein n=1 Tax=Ferruginibacter sp. SUN106 TaxID=2978348 RepID=UPI003D35E631
MTRYNIFGQVHKGLRAMLYETALCLQQTDFNNTEEAENSLTLLGQTIDLFDKHAHTEDTMVFTAIEHTEPALVNAFEKEHEEDHALGQRLRGLLTAFGHTVSSDDKIITGDAITQSFIEFMIFNLKHMAKEEDIINKALWKSYTDIELHGITQKIVASIPPQHVAQFSRWMMRGLNNNEITGWLKEVKNNAPDFVFQSLMQTAEQELNAPRWQQVQETITEGAMLA